MRTLLRSESSALIVTLAFAPLLLAQQGQPAPPSPRGLPAPGIGLQQQGAFGTRILTPRTLENRELPEKDQKKYDSVIAAMQKRAVAANPRAQTSSRTSELSSAFRLGSTHLRYGQEVAAKEAFDQAWQMLPELYRDTKSATAATAQVRTHLRELQTIAGKDPELVLSLMSELNPAYQRAYEAIEQPKAKDQFAQPLAQAWFQLMLMGQLEKESLSKAAEWVMRFPQMALADRPLPPDHAAQYQSQLTQVSIQATDKLRQLAERHIGRPAAPGAALGANAPETIDPMAAQVLTALDEKRGPITLFMEADVHLRYGQFRDGMTVTANAWRELLGYYRNNPRNLSPVDTLVHFDAVSRLADLNPVQGLLMIDQLDPMYRQMLQVDRLFGVQVADPWSKLAGTLPLPPPMLAKAVFWLEHVSKQHKNLESNYAEPLADIKQQLEQANQKDGAANGNTAGPANDDGEKTPDTARSRRGINIPRSVDHNDQGAGN